VSTRPASTVSRGCCWDNEPRAEPFDVPIRDESIRLGQFLKLANLVESGAEAKPVIAAGMVRVNDEVETRRGRQLVKGDVVSLAGQAARVADEGADDGLPW
jgi:ribosome-associated protein